MSAEAREKRARELVGMLGFAVLEEGEETLFLSADGGGGCDGGAAPPALAVGNNIIVLLDRASAAQAIVPRALRACVLPPGTAPTRELLHSATPARSAILALTLTLYASC